MNETSLKNLLQEAPETKAGVNVHLHQDIMRSVRLAGPRVGKSRRGLAMPALGGAFIAVLLAGLVVFKPAQEQAAPPQPAGQAQSGTGHPGAPLLNLGDSLLARLQKAAPSEDELRQELQHLKSDLEKVGFKS